MVDKPHLLLPLSIPCSFSSLVAAQVSFFPQRIDPNLLCWKDWFFSSPLFTGCCSLLLHFTKRFPTHHIPFVHQETFLLVNRISHPDNLPVGSRAWRTPMVKCQSLQWTCHQVDPFGDGAILEAKHWHLLVAEPTCGGHSSKTTLVEGSIGCQVYTLSTSPPARGEGRAGRKKRLSDIHRTGCVVLLIVRVLLCSLVHIHMGC